MWLPEITSSAFCKRFKPRRERSWSELRQSTEEFVWELDSNSSARNPAEAFSQQSQSYCEYKPNWQICSTGGAEGAEGEGNFPMSIPPCFPMSWFILRRINSLRKYFGPWECQKRACVREVAAVLLDLALQTVSKYAYRSTCAIKPAHEVIHCAYKHHFFHLSNASSCHCQVLTSNPFHPG